MKRLLTIQDISCVGQCSTTVALPLISACGVECAVLPPAILSNHTAAGFHGWIFRDLTDDMKLIEEKWVKESIRFDAFYTGYVCESHIDPIISIIGSCSNPGAVRIVDPAMADNGQLYAGFAGDFPSKMAKLVKGSDYILPNLTEAALLVGLDPKEFLSRPLKSAADDVPASYAELFRRLHGLGAKTVVLTGVQRGECELGFAISDGEEVRCGFNPRHPRMSHGTGDVFASVFAGAIVRGRSAYDSAKLAADMVCASLAATAPDHWYGVSFESVIPRLSTSFG